MQFKIIKLRRFILYWIDGVTEEINGKSLRDALERSGYGMNILKHLEHWEPI